MIRIDVFINAFDNPEFGAPGHKEHVFTCRVVVGEERAGTVVDCANLLAFAGGEGDLVRLSVGGCEGINFVLYCELSAVA